jgi:hypothetical protein
MLARHGLIYATDTFQHIPSPFMLQDAVHTLFLHQMRPNRGSASTEVTAPFHVMAVHSAKLNACLQCTAYLHYHTSTTWMPATCTSRDTCGRSVKHIWYPYKIYEVLLGYTNTVLVIVHIFGVFYTCTHLQALCLNAGVWWNKSESFQSDATYIFFRRCRIFVVDTLTNPSLGFCSR